MPVDRYDPSALHRRRGARTGCAIRLHSSLARNI